MTELDSSLIEAVRALYEALERLPPDKRLRIMRALCVLLDVPMKVDE